MLMVGDESDGAVVSAEGIGYRLFAIKEEAIYVIALADQIEPRRVCRRPFCLSYAAMAASSSMA